MRALIAEYANSWGHPSKENSNLHDFLFTRRGKWVEIDTKFLFDNQYNTVDGYRIYDVHIAKIENDERTEQSFFVRHPDGIDPIKPIDITNRDHKKAGFYSLSGYPSLGYYRISRRSNIHFVLVNGLPYIHNGIGYYKNYNLTNGEKKILAKCVKLVNEFQQ